MSADLMAFLRARVDDDEQEARDTAAGWGASWTAADGMGVVQSDTGADVVEEYAPIHHIARHDPERALAEVAAKRQMLNDYALTVQLRDEAAERIRAAGDRPDARDLDTWDRAQREAAILAPWVHLLALPFAAHAGYRTEWAPDA